MLLKITIFSKNLIYLILLKIIFIKTNKVVLLDFNSSFKTGLNTGFSFIDDLQERNLYSILNIGEPEHEIKTILSMKHSYFALIPNNNLDKSNNLYNDYDITKSNTFKNITCLNQHIFESQNDIIAEEKIKLKIFNYKNNIYNETFLNNINLIIGINDKYKENKYLLNIGLQIIVENKYREKQNYNFICQLKEKNIINNYYWSIFFDRGEVQNGAFLYNPNELFNAKGKLVIGDLPSNYNPNNFHKSQLLSTYSFGKDFISTWAIEFNSIFYYDKNNKQVKDTYSKVHININEYIVNAPNSYNYHIKNNFFNLYLSKNICHIYSGNGFDAFYCDKSDNFNINNLKEFPKLYLQNNELQYIFEFTYEDLFVEKDDKYWFLVTFPTYNEIEEWYFGIIFLRKYNLIFNPDSKTISFYNSNLPIVENDNYPKINHNSNIRIIIIIIVIILVVIVSVGLGIYIGKIIYKNKKGKKRFNELDDSFEYESKEYIDQNQGNNNSESNFMGI